MQQPQWSKATHWPLRLDFLAWKMLKEPFHMGKSKAKGRNPTLMSHKLFQRDKSTLWGPVLGFSGENKIEVYHELHRVSLPAQKRRMARGKTSPIREMVWQPTPCLGQSIWRRPFAGTPGQSLGYLSFQTVLTGVKVNLPQGWKRLISKAVTF